MLGICIVDDRKLLAQQNNVKFPQQSTHDEFNDWRDGTAEAMHKTWHEKFN